MMISKLAQYLNEIRSYFKEILNNFTAFIDTWKIQFTLKLLFISSKDAREERDMSVKSEKINSYNR